LLCYKYFIGLISNKSGKSIKKACDLGIKYVNSAILTNPKYGKGHGPINHLNTIKIDKKFK